MTFFRCDHPSSNIFKAKLISHTLETLNEILSINCNWPQLDNKDTHFTEVPST